MSSVQRLTLGKEEKLIHKFRPCLHGYFTIFFNHMAHLEKPYLSWSFSVRFEAWAGVVCNGQWTGFDRTLIKYQTEKRSKENRRNRRLHKHKTKLQLGGNDTFN